MANDPEYHRQPGTALVQSSENTQIGVPQSAEDGETDIAAFKRIRFNRGLLDFSHPSLIMFLDKHKDLYFTRLKSMLRSVHSSIKRTEAYFEDLCLSAAIKDLVSVENNTKYSAILEPNINGTFLTITISLPPGGDQYDDQEARNSVLQVETRIRGRPGSEMGQ